MNRSYTKYGYTLFVVLVFVFAFLPSIKAYAATLSLVPSTATINAGNIINVSVIVNTQGQAINNSDAIIQFPTDLLQVVSVTSSDSIFSLWVENPTFSNSTGQVSFNGGVPNPGFTGAGGKIISITFLAKSAGTASLLFGDSSVRANDGLGTDVLSSKAGAAIIVTSSKVTPPVIVPIQPSPSTEPTAVSTKALIVTSPTQPDQNAWYNNNIIILQWVLPDDADKVETFLGAHADGQPSVSYIPPISTKTIENLDDGVWYFDVNYQGTDGSSPITHYRLQIDTTAPQNVSISATPSPQGGAMLDLKATDILSGVDRYMVTVDTDAPFAIKAGSDGLASAYVPIVTLGDHTISARAFDKAGNSAQATTSVTTDVVSAITIDSYPKSIKPGETITISGTTPFAGAPLTVSVQKDGGRAVTYPVTSSGDAKFQFVSPAMTQTGTYHISVELLRDDGSVSLSSKVVTVVVKNALLIQIGTYTFELLAILVPILAFLLALLLLVYLGWHKFFALRKGRNADLDHIEERVHHSLEVLSEEVSHHIQTVERSAKYRAVSLDEKTAMADLKDAIAEIDAYIGKEVKKIEGKGAKLGKKGK